MEFAIQTFLNGVVASTLYMMVAVGLAIIFGVMRIVNFAHGEFIMIGAYVVWILYTEGTLPFPVAVAASMGIVAGIGIGIERVIFRPVRFQVLNALIISLGLVFILQVAVGEIWGFGIPKPVSPFIPGGIEIMGASIAWNRFMVMPAAAASIGLLYFFLRRFKLGIALRATAMDPEVASLQGISIDRMAMLAMGLAAMIAGLAGGLMSSIYPVTPFLGHAIIMTAFIIIIVGGTGSIVGVIVASFIIGAIHTVITTFVSANVALIAGVLFMLVMLALKPEGIFGRVKA